MYVLPTYVELNIQLLIPVMYAHNLVFSYLRKRLQELGIVIKVHKFIESAPPCSDRTLVKK
jgi:hypothetical protein